MGRDWQQTGNYRTRRTETTRVGSPTHPEGLSPTLGGQETWDKLVVKMTGVDHSIDHV